jgi:hypothetical protein
MEAAGEGRSQAFRTRPLKARARRAVGAARRTGVHSEAVDVAPLQPQPPLQLVVEHDLEQLQGGFGCRFAFVIIALQILLSPPNGAAGESSPAEPQPSRPES